MNSSWILYFYVFQNSFEFNKTVYKEYWVQILIKYESNETLDSVECV